MSDQGLLDIKSIRVDDTSHSKKRVLEQAAQVLSRGDEELGVGIFERLLERERLGSTGLGEGVALPHARMPGITESRASFLRLRKPVDFDSIDGQPVDLVYALLVPEDATEEHLKLLATLAGLFRDPALREQLRRADAEQAFGLLTQSTTHDAA